MDYELWPLGDRALLLRFGDSACIETNRLVHRACAAISHAGLQGVRACAPAYAALVLDLDLPMLARHGGTVALKEQLQALLAPLDAAKAESTPRVRDIPTRYGGEDGPDLAEVAERTGLSAKQVIDVHAGTLYRVAMTGFQPGFPYLLGLPEALHLPRRSSIRSSVPAGSVALAGAQTGIYPASSPGGWHLIGRTALSLFDCQRQPEVWLQPGDAVRFVPVAVARD
ncbi:MAG: 5-oxoprolinase subunit PxpB [Lysobacterales bacterium]|nr:5-oxoprolinase subunit PxpB [Xanthomonadales bacterium]MCB1612214.1 5-oxoprolinase subunit PxpB [Xanthomonadales bacterium]MCP5474038.1 5-oxoprolinase subunit PxpB [Rhodanobacteraceae bacterium]